jgi:8-oxo-dGTP pyrophosphatase MutT (NUDIX family)
MELVKSSILVLCRDAPTLEVLLTQRARHLSLPLQWVFPGGRRDYFPDGTLEDGKVAALRESQEEVSVRVENAVYVETLSHAQEERNRINRVNVYATSMPTYSSISPNPEEVNATQWFTPLAAIDAHRTGKITIPPLTLESLYSIAPFASTQSLLLHSVLRNALCAPCRGVRYVMTKLSQK